MVVGSTLGAGLTDFEVVGIVVDERTIGVNLVKNSMGALAGDGEVGMKVLNVFCASLEVVSTLVPLLVVRRIGVVVSSFSPKAQKKIQTQTHQDCSPIENLCLNLVHPVTTQGGVITLTKEIVSFSCLLSILVPRKTRTTPLRYILLLQVGTTPVHFMETILTSDI